MNHELPSQFAEEGQEPVLLRLIMPINGYSEDKALTMGGRRWFLLRTISEDGEGEKTGEFIGFDLSEFYVVLAVGFMGDAEEKQKELLKNSGHTIENTDREGAFIAYKKWEY